MKKTLSLLAAGVALTAMTPAMAQSVDASRFTGPRIEAMAGYDMSQAGSSVDNEDDSDDQSIEGVSYSGGIGYDFAVGGLVLGIEGEYGNSTAKTEYEDGDFEGFGFGSVETGRDLYVGARAGLALSPSSLVYVKGGYANTRYDILASDGTTELDADFELEGWRAGLGTELGLGPNSFAKLEYRYSHYNKGELKGVGLNADDFDIDTDRHQVVAGIGMRF